MNRAEYLWYSSEITTLEALLQDIPAENAIERLGFESRLEEARAAIQGVVPPVSRRLKLTFRGQPVVAAYGMDADFAGQALDKFTNAAAAVLASLKDKLSDRGRMPEKQQLLFVGPAAGSFGFELELPVPEETMFFEEIHPMGESIKKIQTILQVISEGTDEDLSDLINEVHPRAVAKIYDFLEFQIQHEAWCALAFDRHVFRFQSAEHLKDSAPRLAKDNISEEEKVFEGRLLGLLPVDRRFELETAGEGIKKGRIDLTLEDGKALSQYFMKNVRMTLRERRVGKGNPRYILESLENVTSMTGVCEA